MFVEAENVFERGAIEPARRARIPRPAAAPDVLRVCINVRRDDVWFGAVSGDFIRRARVMGLLP